MLVWNKDDDFIMMNMWAKMPSSIYPFLKFTIGIAEQHSNSTVPVLDVKVWQGKGYSVLHSLYKKPMVSDKVIMGDSAQPNKVKISTLMQEVILENEESVEGM